jgi:hypothetical protein
MVIIIANTTVAEGVIVADIDAVQTEIYRLGFIAAPTPSTASVPLLRFEFTTTAARQDPRWSWPKNRNITLTSHVARR